MREKDTNNVARNAMFELSLAADWKNGGAAVELGEPDILLHLGGAVFQVECKRPFYERSVWPNIEEGASQLGRELDKAGNEKGYGIVAISLSRVFTQGDLVCFANQDEGRRFVSDALDSMIDEHTDEWRLSQFKHFHERIVAVMFQLAVPWDMNGQRLIHTAMAHFVQAGKSVAGWTILSNHMGSLY